MVSAGPECDDEAFSAELRHAIAAGPDGGLPVHAFMQKCIAHYYARGDVLGRTGDFITAPEISQIFGELIGLWCVVAWQQMGAPRRFNLVELGPGRGTMMRDMLRAMRAVPECLQAVQVRLIEPSPSLRAVQAQTLSNAALTSEQIAWIDDAAALESLPAIVVGNEYVDALAVHQLVRVGDAWVTRCVRASAEGLQFAASGPPGKMHDAVHAQIAAHLAPYAREGDILEYRPLSADLAALAARADGGVVLLLIDYGHTRTSIGDTLQAVRSHAFEDPLATPGRADVTTQVDFEVLGRQLSAAGLAVQRAVTQAELLAALGIAARASRLMAANPAMANVIEMAVARLMSPTGMGTRFKVLGARSPHMPALPGLPP